MTLNNSTFTLQIHRQLLPSLVLTKIRSPHPLSLTDDFILDLVLLHAHITRGVDETFVAQGRVLLRKVDLLDALD